MKLLAYGFLLVLAMSGMKKCDHDVEGHGAELNKAFDLELNKTMVIKDGKVGITFLSNKESRCPSGVNCMRAGEAKASFSFTDGKNTEEIVLEAKGNCQKDDGSCGETKTSMGYKIKLISINPYPGTSEKGQVAKATLQVMKN